GTAGWSRCCAEGTAAHPAGDRTAIPAGAQPHRHAVALDLPRTAAVASAASRGPMPRLHLVCFAWLIGLTWLAAALPGVARAQAPISPQVAQKLAQGTLREYLELLALPNDAINP